MPKKKKITARPDGPVFAYCRKSVVKWPDGCVTREQKEAHVEDLRRVRRAELMDDAARHGLTIDAWYDDMGVSGRGEFLEKRDGFARLRADAAAQGARAILARDLSRLFRNMVQQEIWLQDMESSGVEVYAEGERQTAEGDADRRMLRQIIGAVNENKAEKDGGIIRGKLAVKVRDGHWVGRNRSCWGLTYDPASKGFLLDPDTLPCAVAVFEAVLCARGVARQAAGELARRSAAGEPDAFLSPLGRPWTTAAVLCVVRNPLYRREVRWGGLVIEASPKIPESVPPDLVRAVTDLLALRTAQHETPARAAMRGAPGRAQPYTYSGMITCGHCGQPVRGQASGRKPGPRTVNPGGSLYVCRARHAARAHCPDSFLVSGARVDRVVGQAMAEAVRRIGEHLAGVGQDAAAGQARKPAARRAAPDAEKLLAALEEKRRRCRRAYNEGHTSWEDFVADMDGFKREEAALRERLARADAPAADPDAPALSASEWEMFAAAVGHLWPPPSPDVGTACDPDKSLLLRQMGVRLTLSSESRPLAVPRPARRPAVTGRPPVAAGPITIRMELAALGLTGERAVRVTEDERDWDRFRSYRILDRRLPTGEWGPALPEPPAP